MSCPTATTTCGAAAAASIPPVVFAPALGFAVALVVFVLLSLRRDDDNWLRLLAGIALPLMALLQIAALIAFHFGAAVVGGIAGLNHLE